MRASELRIGNIIKIKKPILKDLISEGFQKIYTDRTTVIYVGYDYLGVIIDNSEVEIMLQDIEPIPLTEEWLFKFGFEYYPSKRENRAFRKGKLQIVLSGNYIYPNGRTYYKSWCIIESQPKTVHQLQNLYFALTGEELTLNK